MNTYFSRADRFLASHMTGGEYGSLWQYAHDRALDGLDEARKEALTFKEFRRLQNSGDARIVLNSAAAGDTVPVVLVLTQDGKQPRNLVLGSVNFSDEALRTTFTNFGSEAFKDPKDVRRAQQNIEEARNMFPPLRPDQLPGKSAAQLEYEREVLGLDV